MRPSRAPSRSTTCSQSAPIALNLCARSRGAVAYAVSRAKSPRNRRTQRLSFKSMAGSRRMAGGRSVEADKIAQHARTGGGGALRVKLHAVKIAPGDAGTEYRPIAATGEGGIALRNGETEQEESMGVPAEPLEQGRRPLDVDRIPPHVRHGSTGCVGEPDGGPGDYAQAARG